MNHQLLSDGCVEALREDLPTTADERRITTRLAAAGLAVSTALASQSASAAATSGLWSAIAVKFGSLPLLTQLVVVTAGTAALATPPVVFYESTRATRPAVTKPVTLAVPSSPSSSSAQAPTPIVAASVSPIAPTNRVSANAPANEQPAPPRKSSSESSLSDEARLLDTALASIRSKDLRQAQQLIEQHALRYPKGQLAAERERARAKLTQALDASTNDTH